jgi:para-aminobenzoate synthetase component 1
MAEQLTILKTKPVLCKPHLRKINVSANLAALNHLFAGLEHPSILGGNDSKKDADGFTYWAAEPIDVFEFTSKQKQPFVKLKEALEKYRLVDDFRQNQSAQPFPGGWMGYFSYELGRYIEKLPQTTVDDLEMPLVRLCFYDRLIAYDHNEKTVWLIALELSDDTETPEQKLNGLEKLFHQSFQIPTKPPCPVDIESVNFSNLRCNMYKDYYLEAVKKIRSYIYDGDVYQINFSQRFETEFIAEPVELFNWQNHFNPSPYSAYIDAGDFQIVSASPEMFITVRDDIISTKPIKGTRPRYKGKNHSLQKTNDKNFAELVNSEKEQAELNMIIDLERNDLVKICEYGTRKVTQPRTIEIYPTVYHAVATVAGRLREDIDLCEILKAVFPGGSITGAPKIRAMEIIDETEPTERSVYTGSIGYIGLDGTVCLNIAIRTIIIKNRTAYAQTGGGIVADSVPEAEWDETLVKARALLAGINAVR